MIAPLAPAGGDFLRSAGICLIRYPTQQFGRSLEATVADTLQFLREDPNRQIGRYTEYGNAQQSTRAFQRA